MPIVALTATAFDGDRERCLAAGMDEHLAKPFAEGDLLAVVQRYLGRSRCRQPTALALAKAASLTRKASTWPAPRAWPARIAASCFAA